MSNDLYRLHVSEESFASAVVELARLLGYRLIYHTYDSRRSAAGFPDLILVHPARGWIAALELKSSKGVSTPMQDDWVASLNACGVPAFIVWPCDFEAVRALLEYRDRSKLDAR